MFRYTRLSLVREIAVWIVALIGLLPFYFLISTAFKTDAEVLSAKPTSLPSSPTFDNFVAVATVEGSNNILRGLFFSAIITALTIVGLVIFGSLAAYVMARATSRWSSLTFYLFLTAIVLPPQLALIPIYTGARELGMVGTWYGLTIVYIGALMPLAVFLYAGFFRELPREYEESAAVDGASPGRVFFQIVLPLLAPATGTVAIMTGLIVWNDFFTSLIFLSGSDIQTAPVSMYFYVGGLFTAWNKIFSIVIISMIPILAFYLFAQKRFIQGFAGGIK